MVKKSQLYNLIQTKKTKRLEALDEKYKPLFAAEIEKIEKANNLDELLSQFLDAHHDAMRLADKLYPFATDWSGIFRTYANMNWFLDVDALKGDLVDWRDWCQDTPEYKELIYAKDSEKNEIRDEFKKVEALVKQATTAKQAIPLLEEIGFDCSEIVEEEKYMLTTTNINKDLLGLEKSK